MKEIHLIILSLLTAFTTVAQKTTTISQQIWGSYVNQTRLSNKWGFWAEGQMRTKEDFVTDFSVGIARFAATYYLNDLTKISAGYAFVNHYPGDAHPGISQPEHRPWQQIQWHNNFPKLKMMQWIRLEERYRRKIKDADELASGYQFNYRTRYNFALAFPLNNKAFAPKTFSFVANDEVHINFGKEIIYNSFDQNRLFLGFNFHTNAHDQFQFGYLNVFQQLASGHRYKIINALRVGYFHNLDLRRNKARS